jgi:Abnormal spindle-like microcephaly-assoc'd, ASPM-SPD-2-Hydin/Bacterial cadherin-like domain/Multicopper oxidase
MRSKAFNAIFGKCGLATSVLLLAGGLAQADTLSLTAKRVTTTLPDGQTVPMWGLFCDPGTASGGVTCTKMAGGAQSTSDWQPPLITLQSGHSLTIHLTNQLTTPAAQIPTSLTIVGQLGGGLGTSATAVASPTHSTQGTTWPGTLGGTTGPDDTVNVPPGQPARVQSFATQVGGGAAADLPAWNNLRPGTYLLESGTHPSIQGPMGLYGVVVVTDANYPSSTVHFDKDVPLLLSEIDPVQNEAVDVAVNTANFSETKVWNGQAGECGDPQSAVANTCYPPAVNYAPLYYLINGISFDRTKVAASTLAGPGATATNGSVLLRFVNAGLRMHVPTVVGSSLTLFAEDGNILPGVPKVQDEVFLAAGKTYDVGIQPDKNTDGTYAARSYPIYDRQLSLSTNNQRDGGMQAYLSVNGASGPNTATATALTKTYFCASGQTLAITDPGLGVLGGSTYANGAKLGTTSLPGTLAFNSNGTFIYTPPTSGSCAGSFNYTVNGTLSLTATISQCDNSSHSAAGCSINSNPTAVADNYTSQVSRHLQVSAPGVLVNDTDPAGLPLTAVLNACSVTPGFTCLTASQVSLNANGSFTVNAPGAGNYVFSYHAINTKNQTSAPVNVAVVSPAGSGINVQVRDAKTNLPINDYRWIIEEDQTFWIDPKCQVNANPRPLDSNGKPCPPLPVESLGYNFHTAHMPVVAQGCIGDVSCEKGQTRLGVATACDIGAGDCRTDGTDQKVSTSPADVALDPNRRYFISILPGDGENPVLGGAGGPDDNGKPFSIAAACGTYPGPAWEPGGQAAMCGHAMGGAAISQGFLAQTAAATGPKPELKVILQQTPLPTAKIAVFVFQDDFPLNGENDAGGGVDILAPNEPGIGGFEVKLFDQAGGFGDATGQITYDMFNMPVSNSLAGKIDPLTGLNACPITNRSDRLVGMVPTCPTYESDGKTMSPLAGQVVIANLYPGLYEVVATPGADRIARGEEWLQTNTLDGGKPHEAFIKPDEPSYFQEFGPGNFHVSIGFANPKIINDRRHNDAGTGVCDPRGQRDPTTGLFAGGGGLTCSSVLNGRVTNAHMSRTPDQRVYSSETGDAYSFTQCYVSFGAPDEADFAFTKCDANGEFHFEGLPKGNFKLTVFDQWNDLIVDGLVLPVTVDGSTVTKEFPVTQWRANLYTRTFLDQNGDGVSQAEEPGLPLVATNIRYRDGSYGFFNNTDLDGYAGFNEVFPFMNWLVVETDNTRYKPVGVHVVYDAGGPVDCSQQPGVDTQPCSDIAAHVASTKESVPLPANLRFPGSRYCAAADCPAGDNAGGSTGRVDPPGVVSEGWQGLLGQNSFVEFAMKPFMEGENGGIRGHVIYASTRPFDDPALSLQLSWEPGVPRVTINLYQEQIDDNGTKTLKLVDTTKSSSWDDWAQGFRPDGVPNMNCPGQDPNSPFFQSLKDSKQWLDQLGVPNATKTPLPNGSQFKCYDGWSQLNQVQPAPYDGMYKFPSVTSVVLTGPTAGQPATTNCTICIDNPSGDGTKMLPAGKYVVEVVLPDGYELVKEEDKNILLGDVYIAPVTQQFAGLGNIFIMPDQAAVNEFYNKTNPIQSTTNNGAVPRHEGDTGSIESFWPCVGQVRVVPDYNSLYPAAGQAAPFAGAARALCDRKEVTLEDQSTALAKFYIFSSTHVAGHFTGIITNDFASEFDPFSPQFGEKFGPPNLPVGMRDWTGTEVTRVYSDQWGVYDGLYYSTYGVNPPNPTGYVPQMAIACMNDPGPIASGSGPITDPSYNPAYSNFCYETPFMPGQTQYMDTPVIPTMAFADGYNLPDSEYPDGTPAISRVDAVNSSGGALGTGPWVGASASVGSLSLTNQGSGYTSVPTVTITGSGSGATATARMEVGTVTASSAPGSYTNQLTPLVFFSAPTGCTGTCLPALGVAQMSGGLTSSTRRVTGVTLLFRGSGYTAPPTVSFSSGPATGSATLRVQSLTLVSGGSGYNDIPTVAFSSGNATATATLGALTANGNLKIVALGDKVVQNPAFSGPNATSAPFNQKTITRHYGFGSTRGTVTIGGVNATIVSWNDATIVANVPSGIPSCSANGPLQRTGSGNATYAAQCGELVITAANGKHSIDAVTVTVGGKAPTVVHGENDSGNALQTAIDAAKPGDLIMVDAGTYREALIMWKPVRLQGVGAASVTINADAHPAGHLDPWRRQINCLFGLTIDGTPANNAGAFDSTYTCPNGMYLRSDRIPDEGFVGWDASSNGNLAQVLQEPSLMGAYEGAGVTVVGRGVRIPADSGDFWGQVGGAGTFPAGSRYITTNDCNLADATRTDGRDYYTGNFYCNPSRIDGVSITNSSQGGGGVFIHGWGHNLEIANTRVFANHGTLAGGINMGNGETPVAFFNDGTICGNGVATPAPLCPPIPNGTVANAEIPFQLNVNLHVHHNSITDNASIGDALFSGTPSGSGGITISAGSDNYVVDHNWISGNLSTGDGGGMGHIGFIANGHINNNWIVFNQSTNPTVPTNGGGLVIIGANSDRTLTNGQECGTFSDTDCPPGIGDGTGPGLVIDGNLILGNSAESGSGGGLRLQGVNGTEVATFNSQSSRWYGVTVENNIIADNVAGWDGAGVSMQDALKVTFVNNTVVANDTTGSAGVLFKALGAPNASSPPPGCNPQPDPQLPQDPSCTDNNAPSVPQPAGFVTMINTPDLVASLGATISCPSGFNYSSNNCRTFSMPYMANNLFWQNRAFHIEITSMGAGLQSQQNLVAMKPALDQTSTGSCENGSLYWDVGVRGDSVSTAPGAGNPTLVMSNSILTSLSGRYANNSNRVPAASPVLAQYCNGSRVPPENGGKGYLSPAGRSETTGLSPVFQLNSIAPSATVDEGNNWINLTYGPLTLFSATGQALMANNVVGPLQGAYSITRASNSALNAGLNSSTTPNHDFFGNSRALSSSNPGVDIGAIELPPSAQTAASLLVSPATLGFGDLNDGTIATKTLTVSNTGGASATVNAPTVSGTGFSRVSGAGGGTCPPSGPTGIAAGGSCTIVVQFAPTSPGPVTGSVNITGSVPVVNAPVTLSGTGTTPTYTATVSPTSLAFGTLATGLTSAVQSVSVSNTGNTPLTGGAFTVSGQYALAGGSCQPTLNVGAVCTVGVVFKPTLAGAQGGTLTVNYANSAIVTGGSVSLSGTGASVLAVAPTAVSFTVPQVLGTTSATQPITVRNSTATPHTITVAASTQFTATGCAGSLAPNTSCAIQVAFSPSAEGFVGGTVTISSDIDVAGSPVNVSGTGIAPVTLSPAVWTREAVRGVGANGPTGVFTLTNNTTSSVTGINPSITPNSQQFKLVSSTCTGTGTLAAGNSCTITVRFSPPPNTTVGEKQATLKVIDSAGTQTSQLFGNAF